MGRVADPIKVQGLAEFTRNLRTLDRELPKALRVAFNDAANVVVNDARPRIPSRSGKARASVRAKSTPTASRVSAGGKRVAYFAWLDYGGRRRGAGGRPYLKEGRYIYAAYYRNKEKYAVFVERALIDVARQAGIEVD